MTQYEALKLSGKLIEQLEAVGVRPSDHKYLRLFEDWREAKQRGEKSGLCRRLSGRQIRSKRADCLRCCEASGKRLQKRFSMKRRRNAPNSQKWPNFALNE